jgi:putative SOS response-associated peptidase YedK
MRVCRQYFQDAYAHWLNSTTRSPGSPSGVAKTRLSERMSASAVSLRVNNVKNDGPALIEAQEVQQLI